MIFALILLRFLRIVPGTLHSHDFTAQYSSIASGSLVPLFPFIITCALFSATLAGPSVVVLGTATGVFASLADRALTGRWFRVGLCSELPMVVVVLNSIWPLSSVSLSAFRSWFRVFPTKLTQTLSLSRRSAVVSTASRCTCKCMAFHTSSRCIHSTIGKARACKTSRQPAGLILWQ